MSCWRRRRCVCVVVVRHLPCVGNWTAVAASAAMTIGVGWLPARRRDAICSVFVSAASPARRRGEVSACICKATLPVRWRRDELSVISVSPPPSDDDKMTEARGPCCCQSRSFTLVGRIKSLATARQLSLTLPVDDVWLGVFSRHDIVSKGLCYYDYSLVLQQHSGFAVVVNVRVEPVVDVVIVW